MEYKLRPGMIMLTWTSMNIDAYKAHIHAGLRKLEELVVNINDIIENRIEKNLKMVRVSTVDIKHCDFLIIKLFLQFDSMIFCHYNDDHYHYIFYCNCYSLKVHPQLF